ncbi:MAG: homoserine dehydrogenase [Oscillospiraceae bacterium]|nr:homoserine dehydrogenase [Oscillospiraceae bacterium]
MKVAILGFGTVGVGVYEMLEKCAGLEPGPVLVRPGKADKPFKVTSIEAIVDDPSVGAVAEVMGGIEPANTYVAMALKAGKHVVTSNKALVAAHGIELCELARINGVSFLFSAACGGGVPFLHNLAIAAQSDKILSLGGILNGTTNFMLDAMQSEGKDYGDVLKQAQALGYAEADPTADVSGLDALRKIMLACAVAYDKLPVDGFSREGIESITAADVADFQARGLTCRLITSGGPAGDSVYAYVEPVLFPASSPECAVVKNFNMAKYNGENAGAIVLMGQGAGRYPTASAVVRDLCGLGSLEMFRPACVEVRADNSNCVHSYYVRVNDDKADRFSFAESKAADNAVRGVTVPMAVPVMHAMAEDIRSEGGSIFFAAMEG